MRFRMEKRYRKDVTENKRNLNSGQEERQAGAMMSACFFNVHILSHQAKEGFCQTFPLYKMSHLQDILIQLQMLLNFRKRYDMLF